MVPTYPFLLLKLSFNFSSINAETHIMRYLLLLSVFICSCSTEPTTDVAWENHRERVKEILSKYEKQLVWVGQEYCDKSPNSICLKEPLCANFLIKRKALLSDKKCRKNPAKCEKDLSNEVENYINLVSSVAKFADIKQSWAIASTDSKDFNKQVINFEFAAYKINNEKIMELEKLEVSDSKAQYAAEYTPPKRSPSGLSIIGSTLQGMGQGLQNTTRNQTNCTSTPNGFGGYYTNCH